MATGNKCPDIGDGYVLVDSSICDYPGACLKDGAAFIFGTADDTEIQAFDLHISAPECNGNGNCNGPVCVYTRNRPKPPAPTPQPLPDGGEQISVPSW